MNLRFYRALCFVLGSVYVVSGCAKIFSPVSAASMIHLALGVNQEVALVGLYAVSFLEVVIGGLFLIGVAPPLVAFVSSFMLVASIIVGMQFLNAPIECGCFGSLVSTKTDSAFLVRNVILLTMSMYILRFHPSSKKKGTGNANQIAG